MINTILAEIVARKYNCVFIMLESVLVYQGKHEGGPAGWTPREELMLQFKATCWQNSFLLERGQPFVLVKSTADWVQPTHVVESNLLSSKSTNLNVNLI